VSLRKVASTAGACPAGRRNANVSARADSTSTPLDVVDRNESRRLGRREHGAHGQAERRCVRADRSLAPLECCIERNSARARQLVERVGDRLEQIGERREAELPLGRGRLRLQHAEAAFVSPGDAVSPDRRLADAGIALDHQRPGPVARRVEERLDGSDLVRATEQRPGDDDRRQQVLPSGCRRTSTRWS
jgi:hypothetical protein